MGCEKFLPLVSAYADDALNEQEKILVESHLRECPRCAEELEGIRRVKAMASGLKQVPPAPFFETRVMSRIAARKAVKARPSVFVSAARAVFAAGVCALLITAGIRGFFPGPSSPSAGSMEELLVKHGAEISEDMLLAKTEISYDDIIALSTGREVQDYD